MVSVLKALLLHSERGQAILRTNTHLFGLEPHCFVGDLLEGMTGRPTTVYLALDIGWTFLVMA